VDVICCEQVTSGIRRLDVRYSDLQRETETVTVTVTATVSFRYKRTSLFMKNKWLKNFNSTLHILFVSGILLSTLEMISHFSTVSLLIMILFTIAYILCCFSGDKVSASGINETHSENSTSMESGSEETRETGSRNIGPLVESKMTIFPVLTEQLKAVINQTDSAAEGLITAFMGINRQAKKQLKSVKELFGNISEQSGRNTLHETQQELQEIQSNFSSMVTFFDKSIAMISDVVNQLSKVDQFALKIKKIGHMTNILALNASIEAAHTGDAGSGFKVIASEINALSRESSSSIGEIAEITEKLTSNVTSIKQELETVHRDTMEIGKRTDTLFTTAMGRIGDTLQDVAARMSTIAEDAEALNKDISNVVVSIQFQDITRQRIEHVITPLETLRNEIAGLIRSAEEGENSTTQPSLSSDDNSLMGHYTMESEREILRKVKEESGNKIHGKV
jgi:methyl-accepting chemotaxis protein